MPFPEAPEPRKSNAPEFSVSELSGAIKRSLEDRFAQVRVRGELGRVTIAKSGHLYADLKDDAAVLNAVMWKGSVSALRFRPEEGMEVIATGRISSFPGKSSYQLVIERLEPAGVGALLQQLEERRRRLAAEGLFDAARKRPIPLLPRVIGVVTSPTGAVIRDILHRLSDRFPVHVLVWPVLVQGEKAPEQVARAIQGFNALPEAGSVPRPDVLIVARGGGSIEDLWAFNEEVVVRAAAASRIPLISAVGHETDTTLIDFASDLRAPTPTGAAEMAVPVRIELLERVGVLGARLSGASGRIQERARLRFQAAGARLPRLEALLAPARQRLDLAEARLAPALRAVVSRQQTGLAGVAGRVRRELLFREIGRRRDRLEAAASRAEGAYRRQLTSARDTVLRSAQAVEALQVRARLALTGQLAGAVARVAAAGKLLEALSFQGVLDRGFALVRAEDGSVVRSAREAGRHKRLQVTFAEGTATVSPVAGRPPPTPPVQGTLF